MYFFKISQTFKCLNSLRPRPNRRHVADDIFKCIFKNENEWISHRISLKFVPKVRINNIPALVQIMAWRLPGDKPLSDPMMVSLLTHICVSRPQWVNLHCLRQKTVTQSDKGLAKIAEGASPRRHAETGPVKVKDTQLMSNKLLLAEILCGEWIPRCVAYVFTALEIAPI